MKKLGFTLVEILVVATIIGLLLGAVTISYTTLSQSSRDAKRKADLEQIRAALEQYRSNNAQSQYPAASNCSTLTSSLTTYLPRMPYDTKSGFNYYCNVDAATLSDYTLAAQLESNSTCNTYPPADSCGTGNNCNYCLGPYGQK